MFRTRRAPVVALAAAALVSALLPHRVGAVRRLVSSEGSDSAEEIVMHPGSSEALSESLPIDQKIVPEFTVDLRKPAKERWVEVVTHFRRPMQQLFEKMKVEIQELLGSWAGAAEWVLNRITAHVVDTEVYEEICAIADMLEVDCGSVRLVQVLYELHAACTSIGVTLPSGPALARTMDWEEPFLKKLTATVHFVGGPHNFSASTWAGYVGVLTGVRHATPDADGLAISVNFRRVGNDDESIFTIAMRKFMQAKAGGMPVGFLVRRALEEEKYGRFEEALRMLTYHKLIAPVYFTVVGTRPRFQALLDSYAADYNASYDPKELKCCCKQNSTLCRLIGRSDLDIKKASTGIAGFFAGIFSRTPKEEVVSCPKMQLSGDFKAERLVENQAGCIAEPKRVAACALQAAEVAVITRGIQGPDQVRRLTSTSLGTEDCEPRPARKYLIQANHDDYARIDEEGTPLSPEGASQDIFDSLPRAKVANMYLANSKPMQDNAKFDRMNLDENEFLFAVLSQAKVLNEHTVYGTAMRPTSGAIETRVPWACSRKTREGLCNANQKATLARNQGFD